MNILYDFDGTLFDTYPQIVENIYQEVNKNRKHLIDRKEVFNLAKVNAKLAMDMLDITPMQRQIILDRQFEVNAALNPPFPFVEKVLQYASTNVIMTHKSRAAVEEILAYYGMTHYFAEIVTKDDGFPKKPDESAYRYLHEKYALDLVVGDRQLDLIPGKKLGIATCSFNNHLPEADYYIDNYANFPLVVLGMKYQIKSHSKENPLLDKEWLKGYFNEQSSEYQKIMKIVGKTDETEIAYLHRIGLSEKVKRTGFYPLDGALFALEHGFSGSVVKAILLHNGFAHHTHDYHSDVQRIYQLFNDFKTPYIEERIKRFNQAL